MLTDEHRTRVKQLFDDQLQAPVEVLLFHIEEEPGQEQFTSVTREVVGELAALSGGRISLTEVPALQKGDSVIEYGIEQFPAMLLRDGNKRDQNLRFYGAPLGYEFMVLLEDLVDVSRGQVRLSDAARTQIEGITQPLVIQVYTTPS